MLRYRRWLPPDCVLVNSKISDVLQQPFQTNLTGFPVDGIDVAPGISRDGRTLVVRLSAHQREVECTITRETLEECFRLPAGADGAGMLKTFADGRHRIVAVAERKMRARFADRYLRGPGLQTGRLHH